MMRKYFGTDGIRGTANVEPVTPITLLRLAMAAGELCRRGNHRHRVVIGKDTRLSGYMLEPALVSGFIAMGMDVMLVGPMPTPAVAMLTRSLRADVGVMISASHNLYQDNGIKLFGPDGYKLSDQEETAIEALMDSKSFELGEGTALGRATRLDDAPGRYMEFVKQTFPKNLRLDGMKIVVDCARIADRQRPLLDRPGHRAPRVHDCKPAAQPLVRPSAELVAHALSGGYVVVIAVGRGNGIARPVFLAVRRIGRAPGMVEHHRFAGPGGLGNQLLELGHINGSQLCIVVEIGHARGLLGEGKTLDIQRQISGHRPGVADVHGPGLARTAQADGISGRRGLAEDGCLAGIHEIVERGPNFSNRGRVFRAALHGDASDLVTGPAPDRTPKSRVRLRGESTTWRLGSSCSASRRIRRIAYNPSIVRHLPVAVRATVPKAE